MRHMRKVRNFFFYASIVCCISVLFTERLEENQQSQFVFWVWSYIGLVLSLVLVTVCQIIIWIKSAIRKRKMINRILGTDHPFRPDQMARWNRVRWFLPHEIVSFASFISWGILFYINCACTAKLKRSGARARDRTWDNTSISRVLYQLSYTREILKNEMAIKFQRPEFLRGTKILSHFQDITKK